MSEQKQSFMQQLDAWADQAVIMPLLDPATENDGDKVIEAVHKAIRAKVLESYKNGLKAGAVGVRKEQQRNAQAKTR